MGKSESGPRTRAGKWGTALRSLKGWGLCLRVQEPWSPEVLGGVWRMSKNTCGREAVAGGGRFKAGDGKRGEHVSMGMMPVKGGLQVGSR